MIGTLVCDVMGVLLHLLQQRRGDLGGHMHP